MRIRLTLWHTGVLALMLIAFSAGVYLLHARQLAARLDEGLQASLEGAAKSLTLEHAEGESSLQSAQSVVTELYLPHQAMMIFDASGHLLAEKPLPGNLQVSLPPLSLPAKNEVRFDSISSGSAKPYGEAGRAGWLRVATQRVCLSSNSQCQIIVVAEPNNALAAELALLRNIFLLAIPAVLLLAGLGGWFLARKTLAPVVNMAESARRISAEHLDERLPVANPRDELGRLTATFNEMLARLESSFTQQRQFMADASHELRTPLSVLWTAAAITLEQPRREEGEYREALTIIDEQVKRLSRIVEEMFTLARADAGGRELRPCDFYLDELIAETARAAGVLASRKQISVEWAPAPETMYRGDEALLKQMLLNLLDNAIKHTAAGGRVLLRLEQAGPNYWVTVADTGTGIPAEAQPHIFERFYRADKARSREANGNASGHGGGAGLGLSIASWIAEAHGGSLTLQDSGPTGSTFRISLPANNAG
ncbi:MAG: ATP-binding protein [Blastocatellia bacterium]